MKHTSLAMSGLSMVASMCVLFLVSGCGSSVRTSGFAASASDKATEKRLASTETMPPLQPYDEQFFVPPPEAGAAP